MKSRWLRLGAVFGVLLGTVGFGVRPAYAVPGEISTVAGGPGSGPAIKVHQSAAALTSSGSHLWVVDQRCCGSILVRMIDTTTGQETVPLLERNDGGWAPSIAVDGSGNVYLGYSTPDGSGRVEKLSPSGQTRVIAGGGTQDHADGVPATSERLHTPSALAIDAAHNVYIAENTYQWVSGPSPGSGDNEIVDSRIRKVGPDGIITTYAGLGPAGVVNPIFNTSYTRVPPVAVPFVDGLPARLAPMNDPEGLAIDSNGDLLIAQAGDGLIRRVDRTGLIWTVAGGGSSTAEGVPATQAGIAPFAIAVTPSGLLLNDKAHQKIRRVSGGTITTVAGNGSWGMSGDGGPATAAAIYATSLAANASGIFFGQGTGAAAIRVVDSSGIVNAYAGMPGGGDGGPALQAQFEGQDLALDGAGNQYVADGNRVRKIDSAGTITPFAGTEAGPTGGDGGPAAQASLCWINSIAFGPDGALYIADWCSIRRVDPSGTISTVAGSGQSGYTPDGGSAVGGSIYYPEGLAFDAAGRLLFGERCGVRRINSDGTLSTIAGNSSLSFYPCPSTGDGGPASSAGLGYVQDLVTDAAGNIYFGEFTSTPTVSRVRRIDTTGTVTTVAGGGSGGDGGQATEAQIQAIAVSLDLQGRLLVAGGNVVRRIEPDGIIHTIAGGGTGGDGVPATASQLRTPRAAVVDSAGNLFIPGYDTHYKASFGVIRKVSAA